MSFYKLLQSSGLVQKAPLARQLLVDFTRPNEMAKMLVRCDQELGGYSTASLDLIEDDKESPVSFARFQGVLNLDLPKKRPDVVQSGYAMFRTQDKPAPSLLSKLIEGIEQGSWDISSSSHLLLKVRGDRRKYFINIQSESALPTDIYQHRLFLKSPGKWETVAVPLKDFILTNWGVIQEQRTMTKESVKTVGIGLIDKQYGPYQLDIEKIEAIDHTALNETGVVENQTATTPIQTIPGKSLPLD